MAEPSRTEVQVFADRREAAAHVADEIETLARAARAEGRPLVLGLASGRTPLAVYDELARRAAQRRLDLSGSLAFALDEYCGLDARDPRSFAAWLERVYAERVGLPRERLHLLSGTVARASSGRHCADFEAALRAAGGVDLQLLGIGRNGHIAFNEPGSALDSRTRRVRLHADTRADAAGEFGPGEVPEEALTMGVATILEARRVRLLAFGAAKRAAVRRALAGPPGEDCPASFLALHADARFWVDAEALGPDASQR